MTALASFLFPKVSSDTSARAFTAIALEKGQKLLECAFIAQKRLLGNVKTNSKVLQQNSFQHF